MARAKTKAASGPPALWLREAQALAVLGVAIYLALALWSYDPRLRWPDQHGSVGVVGLWLGWFLFRAVGYAGYLVPAALAGWAIATAWHPLERVTWPSVAGAGLGLLGLTGLLAQLSGPSGAVYVNRGGALGRILARLLRQSLGEVGSVLVLVTLLAVAGLCLTKISYARAGQALAAWVTGLIAPLGRRRRPAAPAPRAAAVRAPATPAAAPAPAPEPPAPRISTPVMAAPAAPAPRPARPAPAAPATAGKEGAGKEAGPKDPGAKDAAPRDKEKAKRPAAERGLVWQEAFEFSGSGFQLPPLSLLEAGAPGVLRHRSEDDLRQNAELLRRCLADFGAEGRIVQINPGPVITGYEFEPARGVKVTQVVNLADDLALAMKAAAVRVFGPVPGRGTVAIEVPNPEVATVHLREILASKDYAEGRAALPLAFGKDAIGQPAVHDLAAMPHLLVAGATGAGKSAGLNAMICSILFRRTPAEVRFLMIDPKRLELGMYAGIPHLLAPVVTDAKEAAQRLRWIVGRMDERYKLLAARSVRNIEGYNRAVEAPERLPYWVVIVDELADLMMVSAGEVETALARLAQIARAVGIHLVVATQRPSVDVITGLIKANFPARIAFQVATKVDSRTILDQNGAEALLGRGDMLFIPPGASRPIRIHGAWVSEGEVRAMAEFLRKQGQAVYEEGLLQPVKAASGPEGLSDGERDDRDDIYWRAVELVVSQKQASISFIQRRMGLGYPKAARFIDLMEQDRIIGPGDGAKPRQILVGPDYLLRRTGAS
jgi:S-DNA-T family DNA segregation ATPase FtsK/SpoIIIE